jgi:hypothetical protein
MSRLVTWIVAAVVALAASQVAAEQRVPCAKRAVLLRELETRYQEKPIAMGLGANGALIEVLAASDGATWTIILSYPDGMSCMLAAGQDWQSRARVAVHGRDA